MTSATIPTQETKSSAEMFNDLARDIDVAIEAQKPKPAPDPDPPPSDQACPFGDAA